MTPTPCYNCRALEMDIVSRCEHCHALLERTGQRCGAAVRGKWVGQRLETIWNK